MLDTLTPPKKKEALKTATIMCGRRLESGLSIIAVRIGDDYLSLTEGNQMQDMKGFLVTNYWNKTEEKTKKPLNETEIAEYTNGINIVEISDKFALDDHKPSQERGYSCETTPLTKKEALTVGQKLLINENNRGNSK
jgi:hypothetical protein